jgi:hypothetical protein
MIYPSSSFFAYVLFPLPGSPHMTINSILDMDFYSDMFVPGDIDSHLIFEQLVSFQDRISLTSKDGRGVP